MPTYSVLSGTRYTVSARNEEEAQAKLSAYWFGIQCPCEGLQPHVASLFEKAKPCNCVEEVDVDTEIRIEHADGHPDA